MSLLTTASPWINDEQNTTKKRPSTMRKQIKPKMMDENDIESMQNLEPTTIEQSQTINENRNIKINDLLSKMAFVSPDNDGSKLANFNPPPLPLVNNKRPEMGKTGATELQPSDLMPKNPMQPKVNYYKNESGSQTGNIQYKANENNLGIYNNYKNSYDPSINQLKPYYSKMGIATSNANPDDKIMEKINYMIHLLEEQQNEKTNSITEEFILYTFLGVFMIFIVDSFARAGKYVR